VSKIKELFKTTSEEAEERISNPLAFAFIIGWVVWNYELVFFILSTLPVNDKIDEIQLRFSESDFWLNGVVWPTALAVLYLALWLPKILYGIAHAHLTNLHNFWVMSASNQTNPFDFKRELELRRAIMRNWEQFKSAGLNDLLGRISEDPNKLLSLTQSSGSLTLEYNGSPIWGSTTRPEHIKNFYYLLHDMGLTESNDASTHLSKLGKSKIFRDISKEILGKSKTDFGHLAKTKPHQKNSTIK
jgi:hypothetical protein